MMEKKGSDTKSGGKRFARGRGKETLFRVTARNQIELVAIADNKSNIIIGINVVLITVIMAVSGSDLMIGEQHVLQKPEFSIPFSILLVCALTSAVYAILAARPKIIRAAQQTNRSKLFFENFYEESLDEYTQDMHDILESPEKPYDQMIIDMYNVGLVLQRKYSLISKAYNVLMIGLILSVLCFLLLAIIL